MRVSLVDDLSALDEANFWRTLDQRGWCRPVGVDGQRVGHDAIPRTVAELLDDPYRSLASALRRRGGFVKDAALFSEFRWADILRRHIDLQCVLDDFEAALEQALQVSRPPGVAVFGARSAERIPAQ